jgi:hypothetical protein
MPRDFKSSDKGKHVMTADGDVIGTVEKTSGGTAHIKPDADLSRSVRRKLGWEDDAETYRLKKSMVDSFDDDGIHLTADPTA